MSILQRRIFLAALTDCVGFQFREWGEGQRTHMVPSHFLVILPPPPLGSLFGGERIDDRKTMSQLQNTRLAQGLFSDENMMNFSRHPCIL